MEVRRVRFRSRAADRLLCNAGLQIARPGTRTRLQPAIDHLQSQHIRQLFLIVDNGVVLEPPRPQPAKAERRGNARFDQYRAGGQGAVRLAEIRNRSEEHTSDLQSLMRISYAVFCLQKKN